jgi:hypothetical protein
MVKNMTEKKHQNDSPPREKISSNIEVTKRIFAEMAKGHGEKYVVNQGISDVMKTMWEKKRSRNKWKTE